MSMEMDSLILCGAMAFNSSNTSAHWQVLLNMGDHFSTTITTWFDATMNGSNDF